MHVCGASFIQQINHHYDFAILDQTASVLAMQMHSKNTQAKFKTLKIYVHLLVWNGSHF